MVTCIVKCQVFGVEVPVLDRGGQSQKSDATRLKSNGVEARAVQHREASAHLMLRAPPSVGEVLALITTRVSMFSIASCCHPCAQL
eukprot:g32422.t1